MKSNALSLILLVGFLGPVHAEEKSTDDSASTEEVLEKHSKGAEEVANDQDELSADVQQLAMEQTDPKVIDLFKQIETIMDEATDQLLEPDTGGKTIAAQTEIIEKIHEAAKARQNQQGNSQAGGAMMDMLERMMGQEPNQQGQPKDGQQPGDTPGTGNKYNESDAQNQASGGLSNQATEERRVPKASGKAGHTLPSEFQKALDAYNRGLEKVK
ncbi:hypothetical protein JIN85_15420 [Luteolibacter pohnpeiensis]|uniref:DUF4175 domain-containing protein n=1 Tax=Luteolibacter pohnpeiensis TaxID=454153 RepID=A0A934VS18_9BACT|nr:hypothetical protein [Luteolibacter pohnpeiensis]MBK1883806.1 hypothetical protein [Luteolibacter pohnpeiensis]